MWITSATVKDNFVKEQAYQQMLDIKDFMNTIFDAGLETGGDLIPPVTPAVALAMVGPGAVFKRGWDLESSARATVDFINNHSAGQITATFDGEQTI